MKRSICRVLLFLHFWSLCLFACENTADISYPSPQNNIDYEIDELLKVAELDLFEGNFNYSLNNIEKAESLLPFTQDQDDYRQLRILFDKALATTCLEGPTDKSHGQFGKFEKLLDSKQCGKKKEKNQEPEVKRHWPIIGPEVMGPYDCLDAVDNTVNVALITASKLPVDRFKLLAIESAIYTIGRGARKCCSESGFWKTCVQPIVDAWKNMEVLGIPTDPAWD